MLGYLRQSQDKCITICMYLFFFFLLNDMYVPVNLYPFCVNILFLTVHIFARGHTCSINCITMPILYDDAQYHAVYWGPRKQIFIPVPRIFEHVWHAMHVWTSQSDQALIPTWRTISSKGSNNVASESAMYLFGSA